MSNTTKSSIYRRTLIKDAGSYILPVMIVLAALIFSMGNIFSVNAAEKPGYIPEPGPVSVPQVITSGGKTGIQISDSQDSVNQTSSGIDIP